MQAYSRGEETKQNDRDDPVRPSEMKQINSFAHAETAGWSLQKVKPVRNAKRSASLERACSC
jgi:hypothetical protein